MSSGGDKMVNYKINTKTLAIIPISNTKTKIYESDDVLIVDKNAKRIISENCEYYGSSYEGRKKGTVDLIGVTHKSPILVEDSNNIIFFPTCSPRLKECSWISLNNLDTYNKLENESVIKFNNDLTIKIPVSSKIINNQVLRATRLESVLNKRRAELIEKKH